MQPSEHDLQISSGDGVAFDSPTTAADDPAGGLDKIRDLLFGREMSNVDRRFARLEARMDAGAQAIRGEVTARLDALEAYIRDELTTLNNTLAQERREREAALQRLEADARAGRDDLARAFAEAREVHERVAQSVRQRILDEATRAQHALRTTGEEIHRALDQRAAELDERKTDRSALAAIFSQAAARLEDGL